VWLQHTPADKRPSCGPGLDYLLSTFGPFDALARILRGSGECGEVDWRFLGLSIPEWTLGCFIALAIYAIVLAARD
jgi:disulfide bond formation protein DsbB